MFTVGVLAQRVHVRSDLVQQCLALRGLRHINHLLNNIVCVLILHHHLEATKIRREDVIKTSEILPRLSSTHLSLNMQTSSISMLRSARVACVTHFSTTFEANLCCESVSTLPNTDLMSVDLSSGFPCSVNEIKIKVRAKIKP